ncbi:MAG TPA: aldehyde dehydrogenase family protein [Terriglobia bacterium]|jgi:aldehyde dehydrogenase (NAD+)|nr:aldehyde dehydrogenase family protein [Terriglobia bacterium]
MPEVYRNLIGGEWVECKSKQTFPNINPANIDEVLGHFQASGAEEVQAACDAAAKAQPAWAALPAPARGEYLFKAAEILESRLAKVAEDMTREEGKTLPEAKGEVKRAINIFRYFGGEGARSFSYHIPSERPNVFCYTMRKPLGVVGLITPWNFPSAIPAWKMAPAIVAGNTVVIKPASLAPLSPYRLVEAMVEAGIPAGVVNYVTGSGGAAGNALVEHPAIRAISFTGSCSVGNALHEKLAGRKVRVQLEMGGKNPTIVLKDANLDYAVDILVNGAFFSTGQKCTACSRAIIEKDIYKPLVEKLVARTKALKVGNGLEPGVQIGPAVDDKQLETDLKYIEIAKKEGAKLLCGGNRLTGGIYDKGYFVEPTIFDGVTPEMRIAQEEVFGPVLALMAANDFDDAMRLANGVQFGLSASIVSRDLTRVHQFINDIEAGLITVNLPTAGVEYQLPFGGTKESSFGMREQGPLALDFYTETRTVYLKYTQ